MPAPILQHSHGRLDMDRLITARFVQSPGTTRTARNKPRSAGIMCLKRLWMATTPRVPHRLSLLPHLPLTHTQRNETQATPCFAWLRNFGAELTSMKEVPSMISQRLPEDDVRAHVEYRCEANFACRFRVRCLAPACHWQWNVHYYLRRDGHPVGSMLAYCTGDHNHSISEGSTAGRVCAPQQQAAAEECAACERRKSVRELRAVLVGRGEDGIPADQQLSEWLRRANMRRRSAAGAVEQPPSQHIAAVISESIDRWVRPPSDRVEGLVVLEGFRLSGVAACAPFTPPGMMATMAPVQDFSLCACA